jgi:O-antigen/teichoic acid export membrane protein
MALCVVLFSSRIEQWMNVPGLAPLLSVAAASLPLAALTMFQEAMYRRQLLFRQVAIRMLVTSAIAGVISIGCAYAGMGSWSLVVQALAMNVMNAAWLWYRPLWRPGRAVSLASYGQIARFSSSVLATRVLDVVSTRSIELLIAATHGAAALGLYAVGSRVFQTLMQLLTAAVTNVSLGALSHFAHDIDRLRRAFTKTMMVSAAIGMPAFVAAAAVSHELSLFLFGSKWIGSGSVMAVLMLLGALQSVQFVNAPTFSALGRPHYIAWMALMKAGTTVLAIWLIPTDGVVDLTIVYAISQLVTTPVTYALLTRSLKLRMRTILAATLPFYISAAAAFGVVLLLRQMLTGGGLGNAATLFILCAGFALAYVLAVMCFGFERIRQVRAIFRR